MPEIADTTFDEREEQCPKCGEWDNLETHYCPLPEGDSKMSKYEIHDGMSEDDAKRLFDIEIENTLAKGLPMMEEPEEEAMSDKQWTPETQEEGEEFISRMCNTCGRQCYPVFADELEKLVVGENGIARCLEWERINNDAAVTAPTVAIVMKLATVQQALHAPKMQRNEFGKFNYRSCEDILEAVKPLLGECVITLSDTIEEVGDRVYVKATARFTDGIESIEATAYAREASDRKGMDDSQLTGSTSSYARKYALNGLLLIDDNKDADTRDNTERPQAKEVDLAKRPGEDLPPATAAELEELKKAREEIEFLIDGNGLRKEFDAMIEKSPRPFDRFDREDLQRVVNWIEQQK